MGRPKGVRQRARAAAAAVMWPSQRPRNFGGIEGASMPAGSLEMSANVFECPYRVPSPSFPVPPSRCLDRGRDIAFSGTELTLGLLLSLPRSRLIGGRQTGARTGEGRLNEGCVVGSDRRARLEAVRTSGRLSAGWSGLYQQLIMICPLGSSWDCAAAKLPS